MAGTSAIQWTEATWNPVTGCDRVSPGCDHCYALRMAGRLKRMGQARYQVDEDPRTSGPGFGVQAHADLIDLPRRWRRPRLVFVNSMSDLFHARIPVDVVKRVFATMEATPQHTYQILTKRSTRLRRLAPQLQWPSNVWMGVSVENQDYAYRVDDLRAVPAAVRFISAEPLLGPVTLGLAGIGWVIAGGESGPGHRPLDLTWARELRDQCQQTPTTRFFFKQVGGATPKAGGRLLDGREWNEMPDPTGPTTGHADDGRMNAAPRDQHAAGAGTRGPAAGAPVAAGEAR